MYALFTQAQTADIRRFKKTASAGEDKAQAEVMRVAKINMAPTRPGAVERGEGGEGEIVKNAHSMLPRGASGNDKRCITNPQRPPGVIHSTHQKNGIAYSLRSSKAEALRCALIGISGSVRVLLGVPTAVYYL